MLDLGFLLTISCVLTAISMLTFVGVIYILARYGGQGVKMMIDRLTGSFNNKDNQNQNATANQGQSPQQPMIASSQSLRQRARQLDFPAQSPEASNAQFGAQSAAQTGGNQNAYPDFPPPQQATLKPRGQFPDFNPQASQQGQTGGFQPSTPSLSPSRPFQAGSQFNAHQQQNQSYGQQQPNQYGQQQGFNAQGYGQQQAQQLGQPPAPNQYAQPPAPNQFGQAPPPNQLGQPPAPNPLGQAQRPSQQPNQYGQQGQQQQAGFNAQGQQANPQQGGLGQNRPPLQSRPRPGNTQYDRPIGRRDNRKGDDRDYIYDDRSSGNFVDDVGDFIDNF